MSGWAGEIRARGRDIALIGRDWTLQWAGVRGRVMELLGGRGRTAPDTVPLPAWGTTVTVDGITMRIDRRMSAHNVRKLIAGRHTSHERALLATVLQPDDVVMELGGGIGMVAIACAMKLGPGRVFSYEANPELESLIRENYALNGAEPTLKMCMLGPEAGSRTFHIAERFSRSSVFGAEQDSRAVEVPVESFNAEIRRIKPTVLIVDIQGGEAELFEYADLGTVRKLLLEVHPGIIGIARANDIRRRLRREGFGEQMRAGQSFLYLRGKALPDGRSS